MASQQRERQENPMPVIDEGWWASVLAEENRAPASRHRGEFQPQAKPARGEEKESAQKESSADWQRLKQLYMQDSIVDLTVTGFNRGGLLVEGNGLHGFVPFSHLVDLAGKVESDSRDYELESYIGRALRAKVIECAPEDGRVVFSERAAQAEAGKRAEIFGALQPGQNVKGVVTNITDFGVFVDLGGVEGLIHISELSWGRVVHPSSIVSLGSAIDAQVLELSPERCRVALSLKRLLSNPWANAALEFPEGSVHSATITSVLSYGAFARLDAGVEGLIHASEIPDLDGKQLKDFLFEGQPAQVRILHIDPAHQRMGLSMRLE